ncbi:MAG: hypothetical protein JXR87_03860, partial [Candidatus Marinimicrobia bacterium]|nr:hypothetical protein [Candidatus Neomarinimicrobiota bacterium]
MTFSNMWREHRYLTRLAIVITLIASSLSGQSLSHPRAVAMGGAFTAIPEGVFSVSSNPANLAFPAAYNSYFYLGGIDWQLTNNFYSLLTSSKYGGKDLTANDGELQQEFIKDLPEDGWRTNSTITVPVPIINFSKGNKAFTTRILYTTDYYISKPALDVIFGNWEKGIEYETDLRIDAMTAIEYAYSMGIPYDNLAFGFSLKYYQGLGYYGLAPGQSSGTIMVDTAAFVLTGAGDYLFRQSGAGRGVGVDFGLTYRDKSGLDIGFCVQNIAGLIKWNSPTLFSEGLGNSILKLMGNQVKTGIFKNSDLNLPFDGESYHYLYEFRDIAADQLFEGDSAYNDYFYSSREVIEDDSSTFTTKLPLVLRFGMAKQMSEILLVAMDFSTSFRDRFNYKQGWRLSMGMEYTYLPKIPFRFGLAVGDISGWEVNLGSGLHFGFAHLDWAVGFHRGIWLHTSEGFHFSLGSYFTGKHKTK